MKLDKKILGNKRKDYLSWDEFFIGIAKLSAGRSKDPSTQVGACIVSDENRILSIYLNLEYFDNCNIINQSSRGASGVNFAILSRTFFLIKYPFGI